MSQKNNKPQSTGGQGKKDRSKQPGGTGGDTGSTNNGGQTGN